MMGETCQQRGLSTGWHFLRGSKVYCWNNLSGKNAGPSTVVSTISTEAMKGFLSRITGKAVN